MNLPRLRILYIAYPLLPVSQDSCGGAEQMLWTLEEELARRGHRTTVAACDGSHVAGELFATGVTPSAADRFEQRDAEQTARLLAMLARVQGSANRFDIVHDKSGGFWRHASEVDAPVLATLHLPRSFYPDRAFDHVAENVRFNCVSESQRQTFSDLPSVIGVVRNGIRVERFVGNHPDGESSHVRGVKIASGQRDYLLWMGRICEEKGTHLAIAVARRTGQRLIVAGDVYPFSYHEDYFARQVRPHIDARDVFYVQRPTVTEKVALLRGARALLLSSLAEETSSLVAMEAMACGTPVLAFRRGAIPEIVRHGVTGFLVDSAEEMAQAVSRAHTIEAMTCRSHVAGNFTAPRMGDGYERLYHQIAELRNCRIAELRESAYECNSVT